MNFKVYVNGAMSGSLNFKWLLFLFFTFLCGLFLQWTKSEMNDKAVSVEGKTTS